MTAPDRHAEFFESVRTKTHDLIEQLMTENRAMRELVESLQAENDQLAARVGLLEKDLLETHGRRELLEAKLQEIQQTSEEIQSRYFEVEQQNLKITNLYVASYQIHGTLVREEVLANIEEILAALIGTECYAIYETLDEQLELVRSMGSPFSPPSLSLSDESAIARAAASGEIAVSDFVAGTISEENPPAVIPLRLAGDCAGVIAIFGFLPHKTAIEPIDHELFDLLATHAGTSLYCSRLHASRTSGEEACA